MKICYQGVSSVPALAVMTDGAGLRLRDGAGGAGSSEGGGTGRQGWGWKAASRAPCEPSGDAGLSLVSGRDFKALHRKRVKMCRSLEVSLALGRPRQGLMKHLPWQVW